MNPWDDLVTAALVGTERRAAAAAPSLPGALGELVSKLDPSDPPTLLLSVAAAVSLHEHAGRIPTTTHPAPKPCDPSDLPRCPDRLAHRLDSMWSGAKLKLLPEWLARVASIGLRVPEQFLPTLLQLGRTHPDLREPIAGVLGARGRWLAAHNPDWSYAVATGTGDSDNADALWSTGTRDERLGALRQLRRTNPARARDLLASTWDQEPPEDRAKFIATFSEGLGRGDEPFLEQALDDKRKEVREIAADLLARLPESRLGARMAQRLEPLLTLSTKRKTSSLDAKLPPECDKAMARDGVEKKAPPGLGEKNWWLQQLIAATPLAWWTTKFGLPPDELVRAATSGDVGTTLLAGWSRAAARQREPAWAAALLPRWLERPREHGYHDLWLDLLDLLPADQLESIALPQLKAGKKNLESFVQALLEATRGPWSTDLCRSILDDLRELIRKNNPNHYPWTWKPTLAEFALRIPLPLIPEALTNWPTDTKAWERWSDALDEFLSLLTFRKEMHDELNALAKAKT